MCMKVNKDKEMENEGRIKELRIRIRRMKGE
jgi:hypothetical protein